MLPLIYEMRGKIREKSTRMGNAKKTDIILQKGEKQPQSHPKLTATNNMGGRTSGEPESFGRKGRVKHKAPSPQGEDPQKHVGSKKKTERP